MRWPFDDDRWVKGEFFKSMGAQFTEECGGGPCKYRGELWSPNKQVRYYVESVHGGRVFCVKNYRTGLGACAIQDTDEVLYLRRVGFDAHVSARGSGPAGADPASPRRCSRAAREPFRQRARCPLRVESLTDCALASKRKAPPASG